MRKPSQAYDLPIPEDYKIATVMQHDKANYESSMIWLYLGAVERHPDFAKIGITMGDLSTRSSSSANPDYHLFCAFQCDQRTTKEQLESIEQSALNYLDNVFGQEKRARHKESQRLSECYYGINFTEFFLSLHDYLLDNHVRYFQTVGYYNDQGFEEAYSLSCYFNTLVSPIVQSRFIELIQRPTWQ